MSTFIAQHIMRSHSIALSATSQQVFPLFEPLGEKLWEHDWDPIMLYPASGTAQEGTIFTTRHGDEPTKIWTIIAYNQAQTHITYFNVLPQSHTSSIDVHCKPLGTQESIAKITYTLTALTPRGNAFLDTFTQKFYQEWITSWQTAISHYLLHGQIHEHKKV